MLFHRRRAQGPDDAVSQPEPPAAPSPAEPPSPAELERITAVTELKDRFEAGDLTQAQFDAQRERLLSEP